MSLEILNNLRYMIQLCPVVFGFVGFVSQKDNTRTKMN